MDTDTGRKGDTFSWTEKCQIQGEVMTDHQLSFNPLCPLSFALSEKIPRHTDRYRNWKPPTDRQTDRQTDRPNTGSKTDRPTDRQTERKEDRQTDRQLDRQTGRGKRTGRQTDRRINETRDIAI